MTTKKTHEVTQALLRFWQSKHDGRDGFWVFDIERQILRFASGQQALSFAAENYLYIPKIEGKRQEDAEKWLADIEAAMISLIRRIETQDFLKGVHGRDLLKTLEALVSLAYRSGYQIKTLIAEMLKDEFLKEHFGVSTEDDAHIAVVENMVNVISLQAEKYFAGTNQVLFDLSLPLLVCESPFFDMDMRGQGTAIGPITPNAAFLLDGNNQQDVPNLSFHQATGDSSGLSTSINSFTIKRARKWIVATTKNQLESIIGELNPEKIAERIEKDRLVFLSPEQHGKTNWLELKKLKK